MTTSSRRDFVTGRAIAHSVRARVAETIVPTTLVHYTRRAMGCGFSLFIPANQPHNPELALSVLDLVADLERLLSIYRADSEISMVNRLAAQQPVRVDSRVLAVLGLAKSIWAETAGAFDITAGPLADLWGVSRNSPRLPDIAAIHQCLSKLGCDKLILDSTNQTVRFSCSGPEINLGGIGKGFALDECHRLLRRHGLSDYMLHGGLSSLLASGHHGGAESPWLVDLRLPGFEQPLLARLPIRDAALATSGDSVQHFEVDGVKFGHILDPRSGQPAAGWQLVTVYAPTAAEADAFSTAFYVLSPEATLQFCRAHPAVSAILVARGDGADVTVHTVGQLPDGVRWGEFPVQPLV